MSGKLRAEVSSLQHTSQADAVHHVKPRRRDRGECSAWLSRDIVKTLGLKLCSGRGRGCGERLGLPKSSSSPAKLAQEEALSTWDVGFELHGLLVMMSLDQWRAREDATRHQRSVHVHILFLASLVQGCGKNTASTAPPECAPLALRGLVHCLYWVSRLLHIRSEIAREARY